MRSISLLFLLCVGVFQSLFGQTSFPESWVGHYQGDLLIHGVDSVRMKIKMHLDIQSTAKDSIFIWKLTYQTDTMNDVREYELHIVDKDKGHYQIDEKNSIVLDAYFRNDTFTSFFGLIDSFIIASYTKTAKDLVFEIIAAKSKPVTTTGNTQQGDEDIPEVNSYLVNGRQRAVLKKIN